MKVSARDDNGASVASINVCCTRAHNAAALTRVSQPIALMNPHMAFYGGYRFMSARIISPNHSLDPVRRPVMFSSCSQMAVSV